MKITAPLRPRRSVQRLDVTPLRELVRDGRQFPTLGVVEKDDPDDPGDHFEIVEDSYGNKFAMVQVTIMPRGVHLFARLGSLGGGAAMGLWRIPAVGTEVVVVIAEGEPEFMSMVVATLDSGSPPDGVSDDKTILVATDEIEVRAPTVHQGGADGSQKAIRGEGYTGAVNAMVGGGDAIPVAEGNPLDTPPAAPMSLGPNLLAGFSYLEGAAVGPLSILKPGFTVLKQAVANFISASSSNGDFLATNAKVK